MLVYVVVLGSPGERFPSKKVKTKEELNRILDFARIGSKTGAPRTVIKISGRHHYVIAKYVGGESQTSKAMRARRNPLWGIAALGMAMTLRRVLTG